MNAPSAPVSSSGNIKLANFGGQPNVFYHTGSGNPESQGVVFRSAIVRPTGQPGTNWIPLPLPTNIGTVLAYDVDPTNGNHIILAGVNRLTNLSEIWITQNFGGQWNQVNNLQTLMANGGGSSPAFVNQSTQGRTTGNLSFGTYWQPSLFKFDPLDPSTIIAGAIDAGVYLSLNNAGSWTVITNPLNPTSSSANITAPIFAYFSPGRFNAQTNAFDVWVGTRGSGVHKAVINFQPPRG